MAAEAKKAEKLSRKGTSRLFKLYQAAGANLGRKNRSCPKCGSGVTMAQHKDRMTCGKCHYTEFSKKGK